MFYGWTTAALSRRLGLDPKNSYHNPYGKDHELVIRKALAAGQQPHAIEDAVRTRLDPMAQWMWVDCAEDLRVEFYDQARDAVVCEFPGRPQYEDVRRRVPGFG